VKKEIEKIEKILNTSPDLFNAQLPEIERKILNEILLLLKDLKLRDGRIVSDGSNLKRVNSIKSKLEKVVVNKQYLNDLKTFADSFVKSADAVNAYYKSAADQFQSSPYHAAIRDTAIGNTLQSLTSIGISQNVISPIRTMLMTAVTSGQSYTALIEALRNEIVSSNDNIGSLSRYAGTYTVTALSNFTGQYMTAINRDIGWKWYRYVGSNIRTTREFCIHMTEKEYVHESEFETVLSGEIDGYQVKLNPATGLPQGMFDGTDATNFTVNVGGWNCRHQLYPVSDESVPEDVRKKLEEKINFAAKSDEKEALFQKEMFIKNQKAKFDAYDDEEWVKEYFDEETGGFFVYHKEHQFDKKIGAFKIERGDYEINSAKILARYGKSVELSSEASTGKKIPDGLLNGRKFDIKGVEGDGKDNIYYDIRDTSKKGAEAIVLYYHKNKFYDEDKIRESYNRYIGNSQSKRLKTVYYIVDDKLHKMK